MVDFPRHSIAIVGLGGRFPGAADLQAFWRNIRAGVETLDPVSVAELEALGVPHRVATDPAYVCKATTLNGVDLFDAGFFGISPREAQILDPQQRVFLECAWEALEHAGHVPGNDEQTVGIYAGTGMNTYLLSQILRNPELMNAVGGYQIMLGNDKDFLATRVSYKLDLRGPGITVQTACSTSLVAVVLACRALERGECDVALAGGVSIPTPQRTGYRYEEGMILSPDGHCRPFDEHAAGTRPSAGCGVVVLKRLADAQADGDTIHAVVLGAAINNDGAGKAGYTAPSIDGQVEVLATAQALAGISPRQVGYIEAHGTGTSLGDPIEIAALTQVFRAATADVGFCRLGSLKANLGHLDAAAGVAGLIKAVLVLQHRELPPLVNFTRPNPRLELPESPFHASAAGESWKSREGERIAGVSSFGIGGTNAHVVLREAPAPVTASAASPGAHLLVLSAKSAAALETMRANLHAYLAEHLDIDLQDVEYTLQLGRRRFEHRSAWVARTASEAIAELSAPRPRHEPLSVPDGTARPVAFLFSGQGSQFAGMARGLYAEHDVYRQAVDHCAQLLQPHLGEDIREALFAAAGDTRINETRLTQPALFVTEYALAQVWIRCGVKPVAMLGHSVGEYVAAHLAGVLSLEDALTVVAARGRLMQAMAPGSMAAVHVGASELQSKLAPGVEIAAMNAPALCTISGPADVLEANLRTLQAAGIETRKLHTSHAFHSAMMEPALQPFLRVLESVRLAPPTAPYVSNVTGTWISAQQAQSPAYYAEHLRRAVNFEAGVRTLGTDPRVLLLEVGPGNVLTTLARQTLGKEGARRVLASMGRPGEERPDGLVFRDALARCWLAGAQLSFRGLHVGKQPRRIPLPTYPFERKRYWVEAVQTAATLPAGTDTDALAAAQARFQATLDDWTYAPTWMRDSAPSGAPPSLSGVWLVLGDDDELANTLVARLRQAGAQGRQVLRPESTDDLHELLAAAGPIVGIIHLWGIGPAAMSPERQYEVLVALGAAGSAPISVLHVSLDSESVLDEPVRHPALALCVGPVLVLPAENPHLRMRRVDLDGSSANSAVTALVNEAGKDDSGARSAWRRGRRWLQTFERIALPPLPSGMPLKEGGVYLITGGLGGMGLSIARWLAERFKARLLLTSRTGARVSSVLEEIESVGGEGVIAIADAGDEVAMVAALADARTRWGRLDGVIHAAGNPGIGRLTALTTLEDARATFRPKVAGLDVLVRLLGETPLDFVALMSSINSVVGAPGACDYAAANAVLDAFAEGAHPQAWRHVVSFSWDAWRDVGMAVDLKVPAAHRQQRQAYVDSGIPTNLGVEAFARGLASRRSRILVESHGILVALSAARLAPVSSRRVRAGDAAAGSQEAGGFAALSADSTEGEAGARPHLSNEFAAADSDLERRLAAIWSEMLGVTPIGRHDDFFELGGHSLLATRVLARVHESLGVKLQLRDIFDAPSISRLASRISALDVGVKPAIATEEREEIEF